jgi:hypothetical protein
MFFHLLVNTQTLSTAQVGNKLITVGVNDLTLGPHQDYNIHITTTTKVGKQMKVIVRTENWNGMAKAVVRDSKGRFIGATNQTESIKAAKVVRPRVSIVGSK